MERIWLSLILLLTTPGLIVSPAIAVAPKESPIVWDLVREGMTKSDAMRTYHLDSLDAFDRVRASTNPRVIANLSFGNSGGTISEVLVTYLDIEPADMEPLLTEKYGKPISSRVVELPPTASRNPGERATQIQWRRGSIRVSLDIAFNPVYAIYSEVTYTIADPRSPPVPL